MVEITSLDDPDPIWICSVNGGHDTDPVRDVDPMSDSVAAWEVMPLAVSFGASLDREAEAAADRVVILVQEREYHDDNAKRLRDELQLRLVEERRALNELIAEARIEADARGRAARAYRKAMKS